MTQGLEGSGTVGPRVQVPNQGLRGVIWSFHLLIWPRFCTFTMSTCLHDYRFFSKVWILAGDSLSHSLLHFGAHACLHACVAKHADTCTPYIDPYVCRKAPGSQAQVHASQLAAHASEKNTHGSGQLPGKRVVDSWYSICKGFVVSILDPKPTHPEPIT